MSAQLVASEPDESSTCAAAVISLVLSLFHGADLFGLAFEREGFCVVAGPDPMFGRDIRDFHPPAGRFDGILGSPPCQSFSPLVHLVRACGHEPGHGNLIPEFERVTAEAAPSWFVMEEVPRAPEPSVSGYAVKSFVIDNSTLCDGTGLGYPQMRKRRFSFGLRGEHAIDLRRWITFAALELPDVQLTHHGETAIGKAYAVAGNRDGDHARRTRSRSWAESCILQGLPPDWLKDSPLTKTGKFTVLGNGVPLSLGSAIAKAVKSALAEIAQVR